jgi:hypothetical protein
MKMRRFNFKALISPLLAPFSNSQKQFTLKRGGVPKMPDPPKPKVGVETVVSILIDNATIILKEIVAKQRAEIVGNQRKIIALEGIIANLRKGRNGQLYYNPAKHSEPTIKVMQLYSGWYVVSVKKGERPVVLSETEYKDFYGSYLLLPMIDNRAVGNYETKIKQNGATNI